jgi:hypothetical protein
MSLIHPWRIGKYKRKRGLLDGRVPSSHSPAGWERDGSLLKYSADRTI